MAENKLQNELRTMQVQEQEERRKLQAELTEMHDKLNKKEEEQKLQPLNSGVRSGLESPEGFQNTQSMISPKGALSYELSDEEVNEAHMVIDTAKDNSIDKALQKRSLTKK
jgi:hypothetical protein